MAGRTEGPRPWRASTCGAGREPRTGGALLAHRQRHSGRQARQGWGAKVIDRLSQDLRSAFPDIKGFSPRNLKYMRAFAEAWPDREIVQGVLAQLPWYHQLALLDKLPGPEERKWYAAMAIEHNWSRNVLVKQIESRLLNSRATRSPTSLPRCPNRSPTWPAKP